MVSIWNFVGQNPPPPVEGRVKQKPHVDHFFVTRICLKSMWTLTKVTFNKSRAKVIVVAMENAKTKFSASKGFQKNKDEERKTNIDQATTTHYTDAVDTLVCSFVTGRGDIGIGAELSGLN